MFDYHVHSHISFDGSTSIKEMAMAAKKAGLREICITDHAEFCPESVDRFGMIDMRAYEKEYNELLTQEIGIVVKRGAEMDVSGDYFDSCREFLRENKLDFVIGSQHYMPSGDPYYASYFEGRDKCETYTEYLEEVYRSVCAFSDYEVLGHLGYVSKYYPDENSRKMEYKEFADRIDAILKVLIETGRGIEINTSGIPKTTEAMPTMEIAARYLKLGGEILTIGSDSHNPGTLAAHFAQTIDGLMAIGCRYLCTFKDRKPTFVPIAECKMR